VFVLENSAKYSSNYRHILIMASLDSTDEIKLLSQIAQAAQLGADIIELQGLSEGLIPALSKATEDTLATNSIQPRDKSQLYPPQITHNNVSLHELASQDELGSKIATITQLSQQTSLDQAPSILKVYGLDDIEMAWSCIKTLDALKRTP